jgi:hypothetical protein
MHTYGYFYNVPFDPSYPSQNLIQSNADGGGNSQFKISNSLQSGRTYVLVVTTYGMRVTGSFSIRVTGPASVGLASITPSTSQPITSTTAWPITSESMQICHIFEKNKP